MSTTPIPSSWSVFDKLMKRAEPLKTYNWNIKDSGWFAAYNAYLLDLKEEYKGHLKKSNKALKNLGGDPSLRSWKNFRPLRLSREEDWADWLMHLIKHSETGILAYTLIGSFGENPQFYFQPKKTYRELTDKSKKYRADMIMQWLDSSYTHIEVKIGDGHLKKTYPTSEVFRKQFGINESKWKNYILLLDEQLQDWENVVAHTDYNVDILPITWTKVAVALRKSLMSTESIVWKSWAYSYVGVIEEILLRIPSEQEESLSSQQLLKRNEIIRKSYL